MSDDDEKATCPLEHRGHPDRPSIAAPGSRICRGHQSKVADVLTQLSTFDTEADEAAHDQTLSRKAGAPISGDRERPLPIDARITEHRQELGTVLASWSLLVAEERKVTPPSVVVGVIPIIGPICTACGHGSCRQIDRSFREPISRPLPALCAFLSRNHDWSCMQPWADDYAGEILALGRRAWSLLHPSGRRQFTNKVMRCIELDEVDMSRCPGNMWAFITPDDPYAEAKSAIVCDQCGTEVTSDKWFSYGKKVFSVEKERAA